MIPLITLRFIIHHSKEKRHLGASHSDYDDLPDLVLIEDAEVGCYNQVLVAVTAVGGNLLTRYCVLDL